MGVNGHSMSWVDLDVVLVFLSCNLSSSFLQFFAGFTFFFIKVTLWKFSWNLSLTLMIYFRIMLFYVYSGDLNNEHLNKGNI